MVWALILILIATGTLYISSVGAVISITKNADTLSDTETWLMRGLVENGLGVYAAWLSVATLINLTIVLAEKTKTSVATASNVSLVILGVEITTWFLVDVLLLDNFTRYLITPYSVCGFALSAIYHNNKHLNKTNSNYVLIVICLVLAWVVFMLKLVVIIVR